MKKSFAIIGLGRFGLALIEELSKLTDDIIAIDMNKEAVKSASNLIDQVYQADSTSEKAMKTIGVHNADHIVIAFGENFEGTILTYATLKDLGCKNITVRCDKEIHVKILEKLGVTDIISPTNIAGKKLAMRLSAPNFIDYFKLTNEYSVVELPIPATFQTMKLNSLDSRNKFNVNILLIRRGKESISPKADDEIRPGDELFVFGSDKNISELSKFLNKD